MGDFHGVPCPGDHHSNMCNTTSGTEKYEVADLGLLEFLALTQTGLVSRCTGKMDIRFPEYITRKARAQPCR